MEAEGDMDAMESAFMTGLFYLLPVTHRNARTQSAIASRSQLQALRNSVVPAIPKQTHAAAHAQTGCTCKQVLILTLCSVTRPAGGSHLQVVGAMCLHTMWVPCAFTPIGGSAQEEQ